jgi:hypothetical protein
MKARLLFVSYICIAGAVAVGSYSTWNEDTSVAFSLFQLVFLLLIEMFGFPWPHFLGLDTVEDARSRKSSSAAEFSRTCCKPKVGESGVLLIPVEEVLKDGNVSTYGCIIFSIKEASAFVRDLDSELLKSLFAAVGGLAVTIVVSQFEKGSGARIDPRLAVAFNSIEFLAALLPALVQMSFIWAVCIYIRKQNLTVAHEA